VRPNGAIPSIPKGGTVEVNEQTTPEQIKKIAHDVVPVAFAIQFMSKDGRKKFFQEKAKLEARARLKERLTAK